MHRARQPVSQKGWYVQSANYVTPKYSKRVIPVLVPFGSTAGPRLALLSTSEFSMMIDPLELSDRDNDALTLHLDEAGVWVTCTSSDQEVTIGPSHAIFSRTGWSPA